MELSKDPNKAHNYMTPEGIALSYEGNRDPGTGDSLGRTAEAAREYEEDREELIKGVKSYFGTENSTPSKGDHIYVTRYPHSDKWRFATGNSRDHVINGISALKVLGEDEFVKNFVKNRAQRPSISLAYTLDQRIWFMSLYSHLWSWVYTVVEVLYLLFALLWNLIIRTLAWTHKTYTLPDFLKKHPSGAGIKSLNKWRRFWAGLVIHTFSFWYTLNGTDAMHSKTASKVVKFFLSLHYEKTNYLPRIRCNRKVIVPMPYIPSRSSRWSMRLDDACNRDMRIFPDPPERNIELGSLLNALNND